MSRPSCILPSKVCVNLPPGLAQHMDKSEGQSRLKDEQIVCLYSDYKDWVFCEKAVVGVMPKAINDSRPYFTCQAPRFSSKIPSWWLPNREGRRDLILSWPTKTQRISKQLCSVSFDLCFEAAAASCKPLQALAQPREDIILLCFTVSWCNMEPS